MLGAYTVERICGPQSRSTILEMFESAKSTSLRRILVTNPIKHVVIERVAARPGHGVSSLFRFGHSAGAIYGLIVGLQLPCSYLLPRRRQHAAGVGPSSDAARQRAAQLYPPGSAAHQEARRGSGGCDLDRACRAAVAVSLSGGGMSEAPSSYHRCCRTHPGAILRTSEAGPALSLTSRDG
jgi:hypothetical protein